MHYLDNSWYWIFLQLLFKLSVAILCKNGYEKYKVKEKRKSKRKSQIFHKDNLCDQTNFMAITWAENGMWNKPCRG